MAKTVFTNGLTQIKAAFLNALFAHVHDGTDDDGHAPKVDFFDHIALAANALWVKGVDTAGYVSMSLQHTSGTPAKLELNLPTVFMWGKIALGSYGKSFELTAFNNVKMHGRIRIGTTGVITLLSEYNVGSVAQAPDGTIQITSDSFLDSFTFLPVAGYFTDPSTAAQRLTTVSAIPGLLSTNNANMLLQERDASGSIQSITPGNPPTYETVISFVAL